MENNVILRGEYEEFRKRIEAEDNSQNQRLEIIEKNVQQIQELVTSVEKMAISLQSMVKEQEQRLEALENRDGEMWRKVTGYVVIVIIGIVIGYIFK